MPSKKVFHDPTRKRSKIVTICVALALLISICAITLFFYSLINAPTLSKSLRLTSQEMPNTEEDNGSLLPHNSQKNNFTRLRTRLYEKIKQTSTHSPALRIPDANGSLSCAFLVSDDKRSIDNFQMYATNLDVIFPDFLQMDKEHLTKPVYVENTNVIKIAKDAKVKILPFLNNYFDDAWQSDALSTLLRSKYKRSELITNLATTLKMHGADGINIDFESISPADQPLLVLFMTELQTVFHKQNLIVTQDVPFTDENFDLKALGQVNDYLIVMMYDEHSGNDPPGPIASIPWIRENLNRVFSLVPKEKLIAGVGSYGREWDDKGKLITDLSYGTSMQEMKEHGAKISFDTMALNPTFAFDSNDGKSHTVWFLDAVSVYDQMQVIKPRNPAGFALWRLGEEDRSVWTFFGVNNISASDIQTNLTYLPEPKGIHFEGKGDILSVAQESSPGKRTISMQGDLITHESYVETPLPYVIDKLGFKPKKVVLTFDDGPDENYTPKILQILREKQTPAAFFLMGQNAEKNLPLIKKIYDAGHEIGDHTFTHPNITLISPEQLRLELTTTQRLIESQLYVKTILFRAPYDIDTDPQTRSQVIPLATARELGYITIGASIDSQDWQQPGVDAIVDNVMRNVGEGGIILLHDAGGDRTQTIAALPKLIDTLHAKGYVITTIADLLDKQRTDIMPLVGVRGKIVSFSNDRIFSFIFLIRKVIYYSFFLIIGMSLFRIFFLGSLSFIYSIRKKEITDDESQANNFFVSVLIPAHNEANVIEHTLTSLLKSTYNNFEIIVINDGSTDTTTQIVQAVAKKNKHIRLLTSSNRGKTASLNMGLTAAKGEIIITMDADTQFCADAISKMIRHFSNPKVGAVAGNISVGNLVNVLSYWQAIEYITSQNFDRKAFDVLNCITVVPGAMGAFRRQAIEEIGLFSDDTWAEDSDLTIQIIRNGWKVLYEDEAMARTEAPETIAGFLKQRLRWSLGTIQNVYKHKIVMLNPKFGSLGLFAFPNLLVFGLIIPLLSPLLDLQFILLVLGGTLGNALIYYLIFIGLDLVVSIVAFYHDKKPMWMLIFIPIQRLVYRQLMYYALIKAFWVALRGSDTKWNKLARTGNVS